MLKGNAVELDGQRYMRIKDVGMKLDIGDMKIYATNMINGSPELSEYYIPERRINIAKRKPTIKYNTWCYYQYSRPNGVNLR